MSADTDLEWCKDCERPYRLGEHLHAPPHNSQGQYETTPYDPHHLADKKDEPEDRVAKAFNSPAALYFGKIMDIDPKGKYAQMSITKPENGWQKVEYWIKSERLTEESL